MHLNPLSGPAVFLVFLLATACASGNGGLALASPAPGQECSEPAPIDTIAPADLFDEAEILAAVPPARATDSLVAVYSFEVDSLANLSDPRLIGGTVSVTEADALNAAVSQSFRNWRPQGRRFGARLRIEGGAEPRLAFHTQEHCPPVLTVRSRRRATEHLRTLGGEVERATTVVLRMSTDESGRVTQVNLRSSPGATTVNESVMEFAETLRFHPALMDGARVPAWVQLPFTITLW